MYAIYMQENQYAQLPILINIQQISGITIVLMNNLESQDSMEEENRDYLIL